MPDDARDLPQPRIHYRGPRNRAMVAERSALAAACIGAPAAGHGVTILTHGQFSLIDALEHLIRTAAGPGGSAALDLSTWTGNRVEYERLVRLREAGELGGVRFLLDRSSYNREPEACELLVAAFGRETIRTTRNHCKIATIRGPGGDFAVRSSMNLNMNPRIENLDVDNDPALCDFLGAFVDYCFAELDPADWRGNLPGGAPTRFNAETKDALDAVIADLLG